MDEAAYRKTEGILYRYYQKKEELARCQDALQTVAQHMGEVRRVLLDADDLIPSIGIIGKYMAIIGGQGGGPPGDPTATAYSTYQRSVDELKQELRHLMQRKISLQLRQIKLTTELEGIEFALGLLCAEEQKIVEQKYRYQRSNLQVGLALGMDEGTVRYRRRAIVERVARTLRAHTNFRVLSEVFPNFSLKL